MAVGFFHAARVRGFLQEVGRGGTVHCTEDGLNRRQEKFEGESIWETFRLQLRMEMESVRK